jgi:hypothetical protein
MGGGGVIAKGGEAAGLAVDGAEATADVTAGAGVAFSGEAGISATEAGAGDALATGSEASASFAAGVEKVAAEGGSGPLRVGRWMAPKEFEAMQSSNAVQLSRSGVTHVAFPADPETFVSRGPRDGLRGIRRSS